MSDTGYNGWKNYPTWAINLWLSNDEGLYAETLATTRDAMVQVEEVAARTYGADTPPEGFGRSLVGDRIREIVAELSPDLGASFAADLLGYAFDQVAWLEIADAWIESASSLEVL